MGFLDVDECVSGNQCDSNAKCSNNVGSYSCTCKEGFVGSGTQCQGMLYKRSQTTFLSG